MDGDKLLGRLEANEKTMEGILLFSLEAHVKEAKEQRKRVEIAGSENTIKLMKEKEFQAIRLYTYAIRLITELRNYRVESIENKRKGKK